LFIDPANPAAPRSYRFSTLDHVYTAGRITADAVVVNDSTTDHWPVMAHLDYAVDKKPVMVIKRCNFKKNLPVSLRGSSPAFLGLAGY
jgi:hypothetical protein